MTKVTLALLVAFQVGIAGAALAAPQKQSPGFGMSQEQAQNDRTGPARGGEP